MCFNSTAFHRLLTLPPEMIGVRWIWTSTLPPMVNRDGLREQPRGLEEATDNNRRLQIHHPNNAASSVQPGEQPFTSARCTKQTIFVAIYDTEAWHSVQMGSCNFPNIETRLCTTLCYLSINSQSTTRFRDFCLVDDRSIRGVRKWRVE